MLEPFSTALGGPSTARIGPQLSRNCRAPLCQGRPKARPRQSPGFNPRVFDALRDFSVKYVDLAPESQSIPFPG